MTIAELSGVSKRFGQVAALDGLNLSLKRGQVLALLGPNGAGKTTAVRLLLGLTAPTSGSVRVFGHDPQSIDARRRRGAMLQSGKVPETLRVGELLRLFSSYYPRPLPFGEVVRIAGVEGLEKRLFGQLSGGQRQRALFALAFCGNPEFLILDEPTAALDVESRRAFWRQIRMYVDGGGTLLLTTHHLEEADSLADTVAVIDGGRIKALGTPDEIKGKAAARRVRCITALEPDRLEEMPGVISVRRDGLNTEILSSDSDRLVRELFRADASLHGLEVTGAALEDAFLAITAKAKEAAAV